MSMEAFEKIFSTKLKLLYEDKKGRVKVWEHKTLNIHRVVLHYRLGNQTMKYAELAGLVRKEMKDNFKVSWWRGLGFGVLAEDIVIDDDKDELVKLIDDQVNAKGTWQWLITADPVKRRITGMHTWAAGYLTPMFVETARYYKDAGEYDIATYKRPKGKLMNILTAVAGSRMGVEEFHVPE